MSWRKSVEYRKWRIEVIRRDVKCVVCGSMKNRHAHHIKHASYFPELRFDVDNGICVCGKCHVQFHNNFKQSTKQKCDEVDWNNFVALINYVRNLDAKSS